MTVSLKRGWLEEQREALVRLDNTSFSFSFFLFFFFFSFHPFVSLVRRRFPPSLSQRQQNRHRTLKGCSCDRMIDEYASVVRAVVCLLGMSGVLTIFRVAYPPT